MLCNCVIHMCSSFGPCHSSELRDSEHIYREVIAGDQTHAACHRATGSRAVRRNYPVCFVYSDMGERPRFFFPKAPGLAQAIEVAMLATTYCLARHQKPTEAIRSSIAAGDKPIGAAETQRSKI